LVTEITFAPIFGILILMVVVSLLANYLRVPYTVSLVFGGLLASVFFPLSLPQISTDVFLTILLPPVIFEAASKFPLTDLRKNTATILSYAFLGTFLSAIVVAMFAVFLLHFTFLEGLLLGAIIAPTDAVAVITILKKSSAAKRLTAIIEGESLFNDGVAVVMYTTIAAAIVSGVTFSLARFAVATVMSIFVGTAVGIIIGYAVYRLIAFTSDKFMQMILMFLAAYGSYQLAVFFSGSGIISVVITGLILGNYLPRKIPKRNVDDIETFWEFLAFIVTSISFILIGLDVNISIFGHYALAIILSILGVLAARTVAVYSIGGALNLRKKTLPRNWQHLINWAGLRGVISVMLVLGINTLPIAHGAEIAAITFGVVFFSILVQGTSIRFLVKRISPAKTTSKAKQDSEPEAPQESAPQAHRHE
jgi:CPA1 family monovalent cation:H+ antiporter